MVDVLSLAHGRRFNHIFALVFLSLVFVYSYSVLIEPVFPTNFSRIVFLWGIFLSGLTLLSRYVFRENKELSTGFIVLDGVLILLLFISILALNETLTGLGLPLQLTLALFGFSLIFVLDVHRLYIFDHPYVRFLEALAWIVLALSVFLELMAVFPLSYNNLKHTLAFLPLIFFIANTHSGRIGAWASNTPVPLATLSIVWVTFITFLGLTPTVINYPSSTAASMFLLLLVPGLTLYIRRFRKEFFKSTSTKGRFLIFIWIFWIFLGLSILTESLMNVLGLYKGDILVLSTLLLLVAAGLTTSIIFSAVRSKWKILAASVVLCLSLAFFFYNVPNFPLKEFVFISLFSTGLGLTIYGFIVKRTRPHISLLHIAILGFLTLTFISTTHLLERKVELSWGSDAYVERTSLNLTGYEVKGVSEFVRLPDLGLRVPRNLVISLSVEITGLNLEKTVEVELVYDYSRDVLGLNPISKSTAEVSIWPHMLYLDVVPTEEVVAYMRSAYQVAFSGRTPSFKLTSVKVSMVYIPYQSLVETTLIALIALAAYSLLHPIRFSVIWKESY